jgi:hypothetical protein
MSGALAVTCNVGQSRYLYASRKVVLGPVEEAEERAVWSAWTS